MPAASPHGRRPPLPLAALFLSHALAVFAAQQQPPQKPAPFPAWSPPADRAREKTPFAPRPTGGDNIFKGEAERWLAEAAWGGRGPEAHGDAEVARYVSELGRYVASFAPSPRGSYEFVVADDDEANAMTAGGGRVYVTLGMLKEVESEDELAGVLAHEIAHDAFGHAAKTVTRQLFWMTGVRRVGSAAEVAEALERLFAEYEKKPLAAIGESVLGFSRFDELEADRAAFYMLYKAGYNPRALGSALERMERAAEAEADEGEHTREQFLALLFGSHPPTGQRTLAFSWESNFLRIPPKESRRASPAFDAMKRRVSGGKQ